MVVARDSGPGPGVEKTRPPALDPGVELLGEYQGSGYTEPPSLVRRSDGQILQLPPLLYEVLRAINGTRGSAEIAAKVTDQVQRGLAPEDIEFLIDQKLRPQHLVSDPDGSSTALPRPDPFLAFRYRIGVVSERASSALGATFMPLFFPPVLIVLLLGLIVADWWIFFDQGVAQALRQALYHPGLFLPLLAAVVVSAAFHEIGHASACRYGGARPGRMGCGLYLAWPAFYTDVSDTYRLSRRGRLRTDLGGVYFNVVVILITTVVYAVTHNLQALLLLVVIEHMEIVHQLLPVIRLDGYYIVADLTGVPDLFARIGAILRSLLFWRPPDPRVTALKRWVRVAVTTWVLIVVPLLVLELLIVLIHLPRILGTSWDSADRLARAVGPAFGRGNVIGGISDALQILVLAIPITGMILGIGQLFRKGSMWAWRATRRHPIRRILALAAISGFTALLLLAWIPSRNYRPIQPGERGTQGQGLHALFSLAGGAGPLYSERAATHPRPVPPPRPGTPAPPPPIPSSPGGSAPNPVAPGGAPAPPIQTPSVSTPPVGPAPAVTVPSVTVPSVTVPSVTLPPATLPPVTVPPATLPKVTVPPATLPKATAPAMAVPSVTVPTTLPSATLP
jgi:putative peptide zinc metalloprotease protein